VQQLATLATLIGGAVLALLLVGAVLWLADRIRAIPRLRITDRWVVVTGCDSGIGLLLVSALAERGAAVLAMCLHAEGAARATAAGARHVVLADLTDEHALSAAAAQALSISQGRIWGVVHSAGLALPGFVDYQPMPFFRKVMEVNFFAVAALTRAFLPSLRATRGRVVMVSSVDGLVSLPGNAPYDASKFALEAYADALRVELSFWGVDVSVVNPATMNTPMAARFFAEHQRAWDEMARLDPDGEWQRHWPREWLERYIHANTERLLRIAQDPRRVVRHLVHALEARRPRARYLSGTLARTLFYVLWVGPEGLAHDFKRRTVDPPPSVAQVR
jgi:NAD(P)-dependent dehydrogenase (short-subunit alcohol dehydrogenase family)